MSALEIALEVVKICAIAALLAMVANVLRRRPDAEPASLDDLIDHAQRTVTENYPDAEWAMLTVSLPGRPKIVLDVSPPAASVPACRVPGVF